MLFGRLGRHVKAQNWFAVMVDLGVLIIGLFLAFQVDRWWDHRRELAEERSYIDRLIEDVQIDIPNLQYGIGLQTMRLGFADLLMDVAADPAAALQRPMEFLVAVDQAAFTYTPILTRTTFEDLRSTGNMGLIRDTAIKRALYDYHGFDQSQWQYRPLQFDTEFRHFTLTAGVLDDAQSRFLQDHYLLVGPADIDELRAAKPDLEGVKAAVERFRAKPELLDWLGQVRQIQKEAIGTHGGRLERAQKLLELLQAYRGRLGDGG